MRRGIDVENLHDMCRYYEQAFVGLREDKGTITPLLIGAPGGVIQEEQTFLAKRLLLNDDGGFVLSGWTTLKLPEVEKRIDFGTPDIGMIQDGETLIFLSNTSTRIGRKGFRLNHSKSYEFNSYESLGKKSNNKYDINKYDMVWRVFNPSYLPLNDALAKLAIGELIGTPLSLTLGLYTLPNSVYPLVAYKRWTVGYIINSTQIRLFKAVRDYEGEIRRQTGAEVVIV